MEVRIVPVRTVGDACSAPIADIGVGVFVSALREALVTGEIDAAVHSPPYRNARIRATRWWPGTGWC
jgi:porphobilinogen deaminase